MLLSRSIFLKLVTASVVAAAALSGAGSANAGPNWSLGIAAPGVVIGVGDPGPVYYEPAPVYSRPAPIYYPPAPPAYYAPAHNAPMPIYYEPAYRGDGRRFYRRDWDGDRHGDRRHWERERREHRRDWSYRD